MRPLILLAWLPCALSAQTFVVDAAAGPGSQFTSIAAAVSAVPDGSTLLVRSGSYGSFTISGKGLTVLAIGNAGLVETIGSPQMMITGTAANQRVVVRGLWLSQAAPFVRISNCRGFVLLEDVAWGAPTFQLPQILTLAVTNSDQVMARGCGFNCSLLASNLSFENCGLYGRNTVFLGPSIPAAPAVSMLGGTAQFTACTVTGGRGSSTNLQPDQPAVYFSGLARVLAPGTFTAGSGAGGAPAIDGAGTLYLDPAVTLQGNVPPIGTGITTQIAPMPSLRGQSAAPGGTLVASALGPSNVPVLLFAGWIGPIATFPGIAQPIWLDPATDVLLAIGVPQPGVPVTASVAVPNFAALLGIALGWQSVAAGAGWEASNPTVTLVR